jgi:hypothetical protein
MPHGPYRTKRGTRYWGLAVNHAGAEGSRLILACQFVLATTTPTRGTMQVTAALTSFSVGRWIGPLAGMGRHKPPLHQVPRAG